MRRTYSTPPNKLYCSWEVDARPVIQHRADAERTIRHPQIVLIRGRVEFEAAGERRVKTGLEALQREGWYGAGCAWVQGDAENGTEMTVRLPTILSLGTLEVFQEALTIKKCEWVAKDRQGD
jgi:hypothetical protein